MMQVRHLEREGQRAVVLLVCVHAHNDRSAARLSLPAGRYDDDRAVTVVGDVLRRGPEKQPSEPARTAAADHGQLRLRAQLGQPPARCADEHIGSQVELGICCGDVRRELIEDPLVGRRDRVRDDHLAVDLHRRDVRMPSPLVHDVHRTEG